MTAPAFQPLELVKVDDAEHAGRRGRVLLVADHRDDPWADPEFPVIVWVQLMTVRRKTLVPLYERPVPFEPAELAPLFDASGNWVRAGRVVSRKNWPRQRPEAIA